MAVTALSIFSFNNDTNTVDLVGSTSNNQCNVNKLRGFERLLKVGVLIDLNTKIALRVDASEKIGTGHFMRCLALANTLSEEGCTLHFVSRSLPYHLQVEVKSRGFGLTILGGVTDDQLRGELFHSEWLGVSQSQDAVGTIDALKGVIWDWLIVDHYSLDCFWERKLRSSVKKILAIDDIADRNHDCDVLVDQNLYADMRTRYLGKVSPDCLLLLGPKYALLRKEFKRMRIQVSPRIGKIKKILVFFGGVDSENCTGASIRVLSELMLPEVHVDVVIGAQHPSRNQIETECIKYGFDFYIQTDRMAELMAAADLAIGAGGSACWERCCLGLPSMLVSLAANQINIAKTLDELKAAKYLGFSVDVILSKMGSAILDLLSNSKCMEIMSNSAYSLVDGLGTERVASIILRDL